MNNGGFDQELDTLFGSKNVRTVVHLLFLGPRRFSEIKKASTPPLSSKSLSWTLKHLMKFGVVAKDQPTLRIPIEYYGLTPRGKEFLGIIIRAECWTRGENFSGSSHESGVS